MCGKFKVSLGGDKMRIINLIEDTGSEDCFLHEHGLSFYIETQNHKVLLDTGATDAFIENAKIKGVDLTQVDTVILSHGHYDHTGGVMAFAKINQTAKIFVHKNAFGEHYNCKTDVPKYIGMDKKIADLPQVQFVDVSFAIDDELCVFTGVNGEKLNPRGNKTLKIKCGDSFLQDTFDHEQYLVVTEDSKRVLLSGCAHKGILNILDRYKELYKNTPTHVVTGFHTTKDVYTSEDDVIIEKTAEELSKMSTVFYSGHCTGEYAISIMKSVMKEKLVVLHSGDDVL